MGAGELLVWPVRRLTGAGGDLSAGIETSRWSPGTLTRGAWIETGDASDVALCGPELDLITMPSPNAAANSTPAAATASQRTMRRDDAPSPGRIESGRLITALCDGVLLNLDLR